MSEEKTYPPRNSELMAFYDDVSIEEGDTLDTLYGRMWVVVRHGVFYAVPVTAHTRDYEHMFLLTAEFIQKAHVQVVGSVEYLYECERGW